MIERLFSPIMAGAGLRDRLLACLGALSGIALTTAATAALLGSASAIPPIVAPIGASALLVFAVPTSPMAQPWPVIGGNVLSALVGVAVASAALPMPIAAALAVALAILVMSATRSLHPPGGATALTAVIGGHAVTDLGFAFPIEPVALNAALLVATGWAFHRLSRRSYPHRATPAPAADLPPRLRSGILPEDVDGALAAIGESFDIGRDDLVRLLGEAEWRAALRTGGRTSCAALMTRDVVHVGPDTAQDAARSILLARNLRMLPVVDAEAHVVGVVGLRQLLQPGGTVADAMGPATVVGDDATVADLLPLIADGDAHGAVVVDVAGRMVGIVTQTDVLATLARSRPD